MKYMPKRALLALLLALVVALGGCSSQIVVSNENAPAIEIVQATSNPFDAGSDYIAPAQPDAASNAVTAANPLAGQYVDTPADPGAPDAASEVLPGADITVGMVLTGEAPLHPLKCEYRDLISLNGLVFESLIEMSDEWKPRALLSDQWTLTGNTCVFHLRQSVVFHNGAPLTADDVIASYRYIVNAGEASPWYDRVRLISNMEAGEDGTTLTVTFTQGGYAALYAMTFPVVCHSSLDYALPMGTGPYWYITYYVNRYLRLESNPFWWKKTARAQSIVAYRYADTSSALQALLTGEIDTLATRSPHSSFYKKLSSYTTMEYSTLCYEMLVPNLSSGPLADLRVRQAVLYAIDRTALADTVYGGMVQESEVPVVPGTWLYEAQATQFNHSPERALQLLRDVGWTDSNGDGMLDEEVDGLLENFTLTLYTYNESDSESRSDAAKLIASQLKRIGVTVRVVTTTRDKMSTVFKSGKYDLALVAVNLSFVPDLTELLRHDGDCNFNGYANKDMNNLLLSARSAITDEQLSDLYSEIQLKIIADLPILGLYFRTGSVISSHNVNALHGLFETDTFNGMELVEP